MKRALIATLLTFSIVTGSALAEEGTGTIKLDETFTKANEWLSKNNLQLTGSPTMRNDEAAFEQETILFYGEGYGNPAHTNQAQREGMAKRAAVVTAQRAVAEYLEGFAIVSATEVDQGVIIRDHIRTAVASFVKGVQVVFEDYNKEKDTAIAIIKIGLHGPRGFGSYLYEKINSDPVLKKAVATDKPDFKPAPAKIEQVKVDQAKLDQPYDGLIIDATEHDFRPALINRIFTVKGEVLYDPAKVSQKVLVEQGCGEYTNSVDKAKSALAARGVTNPLILKASSAINRADLQVTDDDAVKVFSANQKAGFLAGAKVAFVLK